MIVTPKGAGDFDAEVYAVELTGEAVLVTVAVGDLRIAARADRRWRAQIGSRVGITSNGERLHLFDRDSGARIEG